MATPIFLHGVPDTTHVWSPLMDTLGLEQPNCPALPGFASDIPDGFNCTKDAYVDWFINEMTEAHGQHGPLDVVGHDWGALIVGRAVQLRPDLVRTWTLTNAAPHPDYKWHRMARAFQTPIWGEIVTSMIRPKAMAAGLKSQGLPSQLARHEAANFDSRMKRAILSLYRSAKHAAIEWQDVIDNMPPRGLVFWGEQDPYVPLHIGEDFAKRTGATWVPIAEAGHWALASHPNLFAEALKAHWAEPAP